MLAKFWILLICCLLTITVKAQEKIETDRPDQTESPYLTPKNWVQFEMGFNKQQNDKYNFEYFSPTLLSKWGISKIFELRLITTIVTNQTKLTTPKFSETGLAPVEIGGKIFICEEKKGLPKTSLIFHFAIPTLASKNFKANKLAPNFRFVMQSTLTDKIGLGYNVGAEWGGFSNTPSYIYTFAPGFTLSDKWYGYIEAFGSVNKNESPQHSIDGGLAYFVNNNFKLDISSGFGISKAAPDWYVAVGGSIRFNTKSK
jgi:hypothetical protein